MSLFSFVWWAVLAHFVSGRKGNVFRDWTRYEFPFSPPEENKVMAPCVAMDTRRNILWMLGVGPGSDNRDNRIWALDTVLFNEDPANNMQAALTEVGRAEQDWNCATSSIVYVESRNRIYHLANSGILSSYHVYRHEFDWHVSDAGQTMNGPCLTVSHNDKYLIASYHQWGYDPSTMVYNIDLDRWSYTVEDPDVTPYIPCAMDTDRRWLYQVSNGGLKRLFVGKIGELKKGEESQYQWETVQINPTGDLDRLPVHSMASTQMAYMNGRLFFGGSSSAAFQFAVSFDIRSRKYYMGPELLKPKYWIGWAANPNVNKVYAVGGAISTVKEIDTFMRMSDLLCSQKILNQYGPNLEVCSKEFCNGKESSHKCVAGRYGVFWSDGRELKCANAFAMDAQWCTVVTCGDCGFISDCAMACNRDVNAFGLIGVDCREECKSVDGSWQCWAPALCRQV